MPIYEYECSLCGYVFEVIHKFNKDFPGCPKCSGIVKRKFSLFSFAMKNGTISKSKEVKQEESEDFKYSNLKGK